MNYLSPVWNRSDDSTFSFQSSFIQIYVVCFWIIKKVFTQADVDFLISYDSYNEKKKFPYFQDA